MNEVSVNVSDLSNLLALLENLSTIAEGYGIGKLSILLNRHVEMLRLAISRQHEDDVSIPNLYREIAERTIAEKNVKERESINPINPDDEIERWKEEAKMLCKELQGPKGIAYERVFFLRDPSSSWALYVTTPDVEEQGTLFVMEKISDVLKRLELSLPLIRIKVYASSWSERYLHPDVEQWKRIVICEPE